jgi:F-type H+-transporting ATPase subunit delta
MSEKITLARPYAEAVFRLAEENKALKKWSEMLEFVTAVATDEQVARLATDPRIDHDRFTRMLLDICGKKLSKEGANFLQVLQQNRRLDLLPEITQLFEKLRAEAEGRIEAQVISAFEMKAEQLKKIAVALKARLGREVDLVATVDTSLIGGIIIRAGDLVIDGSVQGRLRALASHLNR